MNDQTWTDPLGQTYGPGDHVAIAMVSDRSPQMVFAEVLEIRTVDKDGNTITAGVFDWEAKQWKEVPSCTVLARPLMDSRGFYRGTNRAVPYKIPANIIKIPAPPATTEGGGQG